jgi:hypothetical protein
MVRLYLSRSVAHCGNRVLNGFDPLVVVKGAPPPLAAALPSLLAFRHEILFLLTVSLCESHCFIQGDL